MESLVKRLDHASVREDLRSREVEPPDRHVVDCPIPGRVPRHSVTLSFLVGTMVAATDPAAILAVMAQSGATRRLTTLVEAESLFNDGTTSIGSRGHARPSGSGSIASRR